MQKESGCHHNIVAVKTAQKLELCELGLLGVSVRAEEALRRGDLEDGRATVCSGAAVLKREEPAMKLKSPET